MAIMATDSLIMGASTTNQNVPNQPEFVRTLKAEFTAGCFDHEQDTFNNHPLIADY